MEVDERRDLTTFLSQFRELVDLAFSDHREWLPEKLVEPLRTAWDDLGPRFDDVETAIESGEYDQALEFEGLSGAQLRAKRTVWRDVITAFHGERRRRTWGRIFGWSGRVLRLFKISMGVANTILESVGKVIPPAGAIKEFKGIFEGALSLGEETRGPVRRLWRRIKRRRRSVT
jgi:hypothetical protein